MNSNPLLPTRITTTSVNLPPQQLSFPHRPADIVIKSRSPPAAKNTLLPVSPQKPSSGYLLHLVPQANQQITHSFQPFQQQQSVNSPRFMGSVQQNRQFIESKGNDQRSNRSDSEVFITANSQGLSMFNRSKGFSDFNTKLQSQVRGKSIAYQTEERAMRSPVSVIGDENGKKSNRSSSQHNIHITIESSNQGEAAPTITINPSKLQHIASPTVYAQNRVVSFPPPPQIISRPTSISQTIISHQSPPIPQPMIVHQPPTIINHHHQPILFQPQLQPQPQSQQNNLASYSYQSTTPVNPNILSTESLKREKVSSLSTGAGDFSRQSKGKKMSIETAARHEYYNQAQILEREGDDSISQANQNRNNRNAYITQQKLFINSRLLDEIFENQTHRALLQIYELNTRSRDRLISKTSRSTKKHRH